MAEDKKKHSLDDDKEAYLLAFVTHRIADIADFVLRGNIDAAHLLLFYASRSLGGSFDESSVIEYWRALGRFEDALQAENLPE